MSTVFVPERRRFLRFLVAAGVGSLAFRAGAFAETPAPAEAERRWSSLGEEERKELIRRWEEFRALPVADQEALRAAYRRFRGLTDAQRAGVKANYEHWKTLSPEKRDELRVRFARWRSLTEEEREKIRRENGDVPEISEPAR